MNKTMSSMDEIWTRKGMRIDSQEPTSPPLKYHCTPLVNWSCLDATKREISCSFSSSRGSEASDIYVCCILLCRLGVWGFIFIRVCVFLYVFGLKYYL